MTDSPKTSAAPFVPATQNLGELRHAAETCEGCDLFRTATQTVFGEGSAHASIMLIGEQPGDKEDIAGQPFVGPAGRVLAEAMRAAGISRAQAYVTNAVKHFKFLQRGKRRMHDRPRAGEIRACHPWLQAELAAVKPKVVVCLGTTAAHSIFAKPTTITSKRGTPTRLPSGALCFVTVHPSSILRALPADREAAMAAFIADLRTAAASSIR